MSGKLPAIQFYPGDWKKDAGVQSLSFHDRGVWFEILLLMHESPERGKLLLGDKVMPQEALARLLGLDNQILTTTLTTLLEYGVASRCESTGALCSRRMIRDEQIRQARTEAGKKGGNPNLVNQNPTTGVKQKQTPSSSSSSSSSSSIENTHTGETEVSERAVKTEAAPFRFIASEYIAAFGGTVHITDKRKRAIQTRWKDSWWREHWQRALEVGSQSAFLRGDGGGWKISFDWFLNPDSVAKIIEGNYSGGKSNQQRKTAAEQREELNASGFDWIRQAASEAAASGSEGGRIPNSSGAVVLIEKHGAIDATRI